MNTILIYLLFTTFFIDQVLGPVGLSGMPGLSSGIPGLSLFNLNIYLLLISWVVSAIKRRKGILQPNNLNIPLALMGYAMVLAIFVKLISSEIPHVRVLMEIVGFKAWLDPVLLFLIFFNLIDDKRTCNHVLIGMSLLFLALIFAQLSTTYGIHDFSGGVHERSGRAGGLRAPGEYAITLVFFLPLVLSGSLLIKKGLLFKISCVILTFLFFMGIVNAGSRNGAVSLLCCVLVYLVLLKKHKIVELVPILFLVLTIIAIGVIAFQVSPPDLKMQIEARFDPANVEDVNTAKDVQKLTTGRSELWKNGWRLFIESPIWGHGRNTYVALSKIRGFSKHSSAHNEYIKYLAEYGIVGFSLFLFVFYRIFQNVGRGLKIATKKWEKILFLSYIAGFCGYLVGIGLTNAGPSTYVFWFYTGIIYKYIALDAIEENFSGGKIIG